jgi:N utilization substance protein A
MFDIKTMTLALDELEQDRGINRAVVLKGIEEALAAAYKKEYGQKGQIVRATFNPENGDLEFKQIKIVVDDSLVYQVTLDEEGKELRPELAEDDERAKFNEEHHIMMDVAKLIKKGAELDDELEFPLESQEDFGRIAAQTAKQVVMQKIREAERESMLKEFGGSVGTIVTGDAQRFERGNLFVDLGKATAIIPYSEQIPGERYRQGERVRAYLYEVDAESRGSFIKLSRAHPQFLVELFKQEVPELQSGEVEVKAVARESGARSKIAIHAPDNNIDPVGAMVGGRGVRVSTVMSELGGEKIDVIEWSETPEHFIEDALSPAEILNVTIHESEDGEPRADVEVLEEQQSLAIGRGGQNVRLAAKLTGYKIDIVAVDATETPASQDDSGSEGFDEVRE